MRKSLIVLSILCFLIGIASCSKSDNNISLGYIVAGQFACTSGACTPYCIVSISGNTFTLNGTNYNGSTTVIYTEQYTKSTTNPNIYNLNNVQGSYITVTGTKGFTFTSVVKTCIFSQ